MLSKKKIVCPDNLIQMAKKRGPVEAVIVNAGKNIEAIIKQESLSFVQGITSGNITESVAQIKKYADVAESFFLGSKTGPANMYRNPSGLSTAIKSAGSFIKKLKFW